MTYFDTSFLVPLILPEAASDEIAAFIRRVPSGQLAIAANQGAQGHVQPRQDPVEGGCAAGGCRSAEGSAATPLIRTVRRDFIAACVAARNFFLQNTGGGVLAPA